MAKRVIFERKQRDGTMAGNAFHNAAVFLFPSPNCGPAAKRGHRLFSTDSAIVREELRTPVKNMGIEHAMPANKLSCSILVSKIYLLWIMSAENRVHVAAYVACHRTSIPLGHGSTDFNGFQCISCTASHFISDSFFYTITAHVSTRKIAAICRWQQCNRFKIL